MSDYHQIPPPPPAYVTMPGVPANEQKNSLGIWALVLGALSFACCGLLTGVPAIMVGLKSQQAEREGLATNGVLGKVGFIVGIVGTALWLLVGAIYLVPVLFSFVLLIPFALFSY